MIKNLVLKAGGVDICAHVGAWSVVAPKVKLERVAGTSAGSIMACLIALKYTPLEIKDMLDATDFNLFLDSWNPLRMLTKYGLYSGDYFLQYIEKKVKAKLNKDNATFTDLWVATEIDLNVFAYDMDTEDVQCFSVSETPNVIVSEAIRCSMSIPGYFKAFRLSNNALNGRLFQDGGVMDTYPITCFDQSCHCPNPETLGFFLYDVKGAKSDNKMTYNQPKSALLSTWNGLMSAQDYETLNNPQDMERSIMIDTLGISATNFGISPAQKEQLCNSGITSGEKWSAPV